MAISGGIDWDAVGSAVHAWVVAGTGLPEDSVLYGGQKKAPRPAAIGVTMRISEDDSFGESWVDTETNYETFADILITAIGVDVADAFTAVAHNRQTGDGPCRLTSTGTFPSAEITADTDLWLIVTTADTFRVALSLQDANAGVFVNLGAAVGTLHLVDTPTTQRLGEEVNYLSRGLVRAMLTIECHTREGVGMNQAVAVLNRIRSRYKLPTMSAIMDEANIGVVDVPKVRQVRARQDAVLFEPRAILEVVLCLPSEEAELGSSIEHADITDENRDETLEV